MLSALRFDKYPAGMSAECTRDCGHAHDFFRGIVRHDDGGTLVAYAVSRGTQEERDADYAVFQDLVALNAAL